MSSKRKAPSDGGAAFPIPSILQGTDKNGFREVVGVPLNGRGMSLRDYFAGQAMAGMSERLELLDQNDIDRNSVFLRGLGTAAYAVADSMLAAREASK